MSATCSSRPTRTAQQPHAATAASSPTRSSAPAAVARQSWAAHGEVIVCDSEGMLAEAERIASEHGGWTAA